MDFIQAPSRAGTWNLHRQIPFSAWSGSLSLNRYCFLHWQACSCRASQYLPCSQVGTCRDHLLCFIGVTYLSDGDHVAWKTIWHSHRLPSRSDEGHLALPAANWIAFVADMGQYKHQRALPFHEWSSVQLAGPSLDGPTRSCRCDPECAELCDTFVDRILLVTSSMWASAD